MSASQAWKQLEKAVATALGGKRKVRGDNFAVSDFDVELADFPHLKIDAKYRKAQAWKHHGMLKEIAKKYCKQPHDVPVLVTKNGREHGAVVSMRLEDFAGLVNALRAARPEGIEYELGVKVGA